MTNDPNAQRIIRLTECNGYRVAVESDSLAATDSKIGEKFIVRGDDMHTMAAELAGQVSIDVLDGCAAAQRSRRNVHRESQWQKARAAGIQK